MGRKSILTDDQWVDIARRQMAGESVRALSREHGVSEASIRGYLARRGQGKNVREVAAMIVETETALNALPPVAQAAAVSLAGKLRSISEALACGAEMGARTFHRLAALANVQVAKVDDADPMGKESIESLKAAGALTELANKAAIPAINLLAANRDTVNRLNEEPPPEDDEMTPERMQEGVRRLAFTLHRAAANTPEQH